MGSYQAVVEAPFPQPPCLLGIRLENGALTGIDYIFSRFGLLAPRTALARDVVRQLTDYFSDAGHRFDLSIELQGTSFQRRVWQALLTIPVGEKASYGVIAKQVASSPRAVGNACRSNPLPVIVPCHRVVSATGLGGYAGHTSGRNIVIKQWLLAHEAG